GACIAGALGPVLLLLGYQWLAFGSPWFPAQRYMPATELSVRGWNGFSLPTLALLRDNLFDLRYGLFAFSPMLLAAVVAPFVARRLGTVDQTELAVIMLAAGALLVFNSANQFALLQWNTGVRYMVPAVPLLFLAMVRVLMAAPRWAQLALVVPSVVISVAVTMMREDVPGSLAMLLREGPVLPIVVVLSKTAEAYA
ncbi:MAG: hypothetical protein KC489_10850, partial [Gemmatimonadetes bacterium]|nr:hypothetical protein [Gemmatimonadota bacterium]